MYPLAKMSSKTKLLRMTLLTFSSLIVAGSAFDSGWHNCLVKIPTGSDLTVSVKQTHPIVAEYEYKVSGKLSNGEPFSVRLKDQTGGHAHLSIGSYRDSPNSIYFRLFSLDPSKAEDDVLSLTDGKLIRQPSAKKSASDNSLGFIGNDLAFHPPSITDEKHAFAEMAIRSKSSSAMQFAQDELETAKASGDQIALATALYDLGSALELDSAKAKSKELEGIFKRALVLLPTEQNRILRLQISYKLALFHERCGDLDAAGTYLRQCIENADQQSALKHLQLELARNMVLKKDLLSANKLISLASPDHSVSESTLNEWGELNPYAVLLQHEIARKLRADLDKSPYELKVEFQISPSGKLTISKIVQISGDPKTNQAFAEMAIWGSTPLRTPFPITRNLRCVALIKHATDLDFSVAISRQK